MGIQFSNRAISKLSASINNSQTAIAITSGDEGEFPSLTAGDYFFGTIFDGSGNVEIVKVTARTGINLTVERAQEGTTALAFDSGAGFELRFTAGAAATLVSEIDTLAAKLGALLEKSVAGGVDITPTATEANNLLHRLSGTITDNIAYLLPEAARILVVENLSEGAFTITVKTSAVGSTGIAVPQGYRQVLISDGVDVVAGAFAEPVAGFFDGKTSAHAGLPVVLGPDGQHIAIGTPALGLQAASELTITSGSVTPTRAFHTVDTEADAASDDLTTIVTTNIADGGMLLLTAANGARDVVVKHAASPSAGEIYLLNGKDFTLDTAEKSILIQRRGAFWVEVLRGNGGEIAGALIFSGEVTPAALTANAADYDPPNLAIASTLRLTSDADRVVTSLAGGTPGRYLLLYNAGTFNLEFKHEDSGTATNRFDFPGGMAIVLLPGDSMTLRYDAVLGRWVLHSLHSSKVNIAGGFRSLKIVAADGGTTAAVTAVAVTMEDTSGRALRAALNETLDLANAGANGLDTGTVAEETWYYVWAISKADGTTDVLASTSATAPTMPSGYTFKALVGAVRTKSGSAVLVGTIQYGREVQYTTPELPVLSSGAQGTYGSAWNAGTSVTALVPTTIASRIHVVANQIGNNARIVVAPNANYDPDYLSSTKAPPVQAGFLAGAVNGASGSSVGSFLLESSTVYISAAANTASHVLGFDLNL